MSTARPRDAVMPVLNEPLNEVIDGQRVELAPMGAFEACIASLLSHFLNEHALANIG